MYHEPPLPHDSPAFNQTDPVHQALASLATVHMWRRSVNSRMSRLGIASYALLLAIAAREQDGATSKP
jgi:hypothetical protein